MLVLTLFSPGPVPAVTIAYLRANLRAAVEGSAWSAIAPTLRTILSNALTLISLCPTVRQEDLHLIALPLLGSLRKTQSTMLPSHVYHAIRQFSTPLIVIQIARMNKLASLLACDSGNLIVRVTERVDSDARGEVEVVSLWRRGRRAGRINLGLT